MITFRIGRPGINFFNPSKVLFFLCLFLLVFPKGGFKIAGVPITWGYLLLGTTGFCILCRKKWKVQIPRYTALLCIFPFQVISLSTIALNGIESMGMTIAFLISFFLLPIAFFLILADDMENLDLPLFFYYFRKSVSFIAWYGICLFFFKQITGKFVEIPFLTTNWGDLGNLENKHINRGNVFKLISTYNNGNIFGICLLMLLPLYSFLEKSRFNRIAVKIALLLTLSRTVWIGLFFHEVCYDLFISRNRKLFLIKLLASLSFLVIFLTAVSHYYGFNFGFFFDLNLGGRVDQLEWLQRPNLLSDQRFDGISEITYMGILRGFGVSGLIAFLLSMVGPLFFYLIQRSNSAIHNSIGLGLINYLFISLSDGALLLIPTMAFFWFLTSLLARKNLSLPERKIPTPHFSSLN